MSSKSIKNFGGKFDRVTKNSVGIDISTEGDYTKYYSYMTAGIETVYIKRIIYNDPATIILWNDGTKTISKCSEKDSYNPEMGVLICVLKKLVGATEVTKLLKDWVPHMRLEETNNHTKIDTSDVRKLYRNK